jgi:hypothetical protein
MPVFRATVWTLSAVDADIDGDAGIRRRVIEYVTESAKTFEAAVRENYLFNPDDAIWFGPISEKSAQRPFKFTTP